MRTVGKVEVILNESTLLIKALEPLERNEILTVFERVENNVISQSVNIRYIDVPKGQLKILLEQENSLYLAERFRERITKRKVVKYYNPLAFGALAAVLEGRREELIDIDSGEWSATLDQQTSLGIRFAQQIKVNDFVARG